MAPPGLLDGLARRRAVARVPYDGAFELDVEWYARELATRAGEVGATLVLEPGRWLVAPAGTFVTRVLYVKDVPGRRIAVCDGGMNDLIRPSLYGAEHPIELVEAGERPLGAVDVVGPVCESGDFFARGRDLPLPEPGDLVAIGHAGAYGRVMASTYNARPLCAEVLVDGEEWRVIRQAGTYADLARGEVVEERSRLDRLVGHRVLLVRARHGLEDVVDAVVHRVDAGQEARPGRPAVRGHRATQHVALPRSIRACRFGRAPCSSRGSRMRQSAPSHAIRITRDI